MNSLFASLFLSLALHLRLSFWFFFSFFFAHSRDEYWFRTRNRWIISPNSCQPTTNRLHECAKEKHHPKYTEEGRRCVEYPFHPNRNLYTAQTANKHTIYFTNELWSLKTLKRIHAKIYIIPFFFARLTRARCVAPIRSDPINYYIVFAFVFRFFVSVIWFQQSNKQNKKKKQKTGTNFTVYSSLALCLALFFFIIIYYSMNTRCTRAACHIDNVSNRRSIIHWPNGLHSNLVLPVTIDHFSHCWAACSCVCVGRRWQRSRTNDRRTQWKVQQATQIPPKHTCSSTQIHAIRSKFARLIGNLETHTSGQYACSVLSIAIAVGRLQKIEREYSWVDCAFFSFLFVFCFVRCDLLPLAIAPSAASNLCDKTN